MNIQLKDITNIIKMGRKKRITKEIKECTHSDSDDSNIIVTKEDNTDTDKNLDVIWNTRLEMINYCDEMSIPLCDYLNQDIMENFVKFLSES
tara:strand:- start:260 stop:535 length:276 start_codon:yes stop_codon:yes gene_type:complete